MLELKTGVNILQTESIKLLRFLKENFNTQLFPLLFLSRFRSASCRNTRRHHHVIRLCTKPVQLLFA